MPTSVKLCQILRQPKSFLRVSVILHFVYPAALKTKNTLRKLSTIGGGTFALLVTPIREKTSVLTVKLAIEFFNEIYSHASNLMCFTICNLRSTRCSFGKCSHQLLQQQNVDCTYAHNFNCKIKKDTNFWLTQPQF